MSDPREDSFLDQTIRKTRKIIKDPSVNPQYSNEILYHDYISPAVSQIVQDVTDASGNGRVFSAITIDLVNDRRRYRIPPYVEQIIGLGRYDQQGRFVWVHDERGGRSLLSARGGPVFRIEGDELIFEPIPGDWKQRFRDSKVDLIFRPGQIVPTHEGEGSFDGTAFDLADTPTFGKRDKRENAYTGYILRFKGGAHSVDIDYRITSYDPTNRRVVLATSLDSGLLQTEDGTYELLPPFGDSCWNAAALVAAAEVMAAGNSNSRFQNIQQLARQEIGKLRKRAVKLPGPGNQGFERTVYSGDSILRSSSPNFFVRVF